MSTDPTQQPIVEEYTLTDGEGLIDVRGDAAECGLVVEDRPMAIVWPDWCGSIGEYIVRSRNREGISERLRAIRQVANSGINVNGSLVEQVRPLLMLFAPGAYQLHYVPSGFWQFQVVWDQGSRAYPECTGIYPEPDALIPTQRPQSLNSERIEYFVERIKLGCRPVAFATSAGGTSRFLLDGHHKVRAYQNLRIEPALLVIERIDAETLSQAEGLTYISGHAKMEKEYRRYRQAIGG